MTKTTSYTTIFTRFKFLLKLFESWKARGGDAGTAAEKRDRGRLGGRKENMRRPTWMNEKINNHEDELVGKEFGGFKESGVPEMWGLEPTEICFPPIIIPVHVHVSNTEASCFLKGPCWINYLILSHS